MALEFSLISKATGEVVDLNQVEEELKALGPDVEPYLEGKGRYEQKADLFLKQQGGFRYWYDFIGKSIAFYEDHYLGSDVLKKEIQEYDSKFPEEVSEYWLMPVLNYLEEHYISKQGGNLHH